MDTIFSADKVTPQQQQLEIDKHNIDLAAELQYSEYMVCTANLCLNTVS